MNYNYMAYVADDALPIAVEYEWAGTVGGSGLGKSISSRSTVTSEKIILGIP